MSSEPLRTALAQRGRVEEAKEALLALLAVAVAPGYTVVAAVAHSASRGPARERLLDGLPGRGSRSSVSERATSPHSSRHIVTDGANPPVIGLGG